MCFKKQLRENQQTSSYADDSRANGKKHNSILKIMLNNNNNRRINLPFYLSKREEKKKSGKIPSTQLTKIHNGRHTKSTMNVERKSVPIYEDLCKRFKCFLFKAEFKIFTSVFIGSSLRHSNMSRFLLYTIIGDFQTKLNSNERFNWSAEREKIKRNKKISFRQFCDNQETQREFSALRTVVRRQRMSWKQFLFEL